MDNNEISSVEGVSNMDQDGVEIPTGSNNNNIDATSSNVLDSSTSAKRANEENTTDENLKRQKMSPTSETVKEDTKEENVSLENVPKEDSKSLPWASIDFEAFIPRFGQEKVDLSKLPFLIHKTENEIESLQRRFMAKEKEWNQLLKTLKLKQMSLIQLRRQQSMGEVLEPEAIEWDDEEDLSNQINVTPQNEAGSNAQTWDTDLHNVIVKTLERYGHNGGYRKAPKSLLQKNSRMTSAIDKGLDDWKLRFLQEDSRSQFQNPNDEGLILKTLLRSNDPSSAVTTSPSSSASTTQKFVPLDQSPNIKFTDILINMVNADRLIKGSGKMKPQDKTVPKPVNTQQNPSANDVTDSLLKTLQKNKTLSISRVTNRNEARRKKKKVRFAGQNQNKGPPIISNETTLCSAEGCGNLATCVCADCRSEWYCSEPCQLVVWDEHSKVCQPPNTGND